MGLKIFLAFSFIQICEMNLNGYGFDLVKSREITRPSISTDFLEK
jgi:hypothetical protein